MFKKIKSIIGHPLPWLLLVCLMIGSCVYAGLGAEQRALKKLTGHDLTKAEVFFSTTTVIIEEK